MKVKRKGKTSYTEKISKHIRSAWCVHSAFAYGDPSEPLKMYQGKDCVEMFLEYIEEEVRRLYATFPQQPMTGAYCCVEKRKRGSRKVSCLPQKF